MAILPHWAQVAILSLRSLFGPTEMPGAQRSTSGLHQIGQISDRAFSSIGHADLHTGTGPEPNWKEIRGMDEGSTSIHSSRLPHLTRSKLGGHERHTVVTSEPQLSATGVSHE